MKKPKSSLSLLASEQTELWLNYNFAQEYGQSDVLSIVMNRDPRINAKHFVPILEHSNPKLLSFPIEEELPMQGRLITRNAYEINQDLHQAMERFEDIIDRKHLDWPRALNVHELQDADGLIKARLDCLGKKGQHSRETLLECSADELKLASRFVNTKKITLIEKTDIIFAALGISLPKQHAAFSYPDTLYYLPQSPRSMSLIEAIDKRFKVLKALYS